MRSNLIFHLGGGDGMPLSVIQTVIKGRSWGRSRSWNYTILGVGVRVRVGSYKFLGVGVGVGGGVDGVKVLGV